MSFAVLDFETTGFVPERTDRVIEVGIVLADTHSALCDARATAQLLPYLIRMCGTSREWATDVRRAAAFAWPAPLGRASRAVAVSRGPATADPNSWLTTVLRATRMPGHSQG